MNDILAFPNNRDRRDGQPRTVNEEGMFLRDYFSNSAMLAIIGRGESEEDIIATNAYIMADAMLAERAKKR